MTQYSVCIYSKVILLTVQWSARPTKLGWQPSGSDVSVKTGKTIAVEMQAIQELFLSEIQEKYDFHC